MTEATAQLTQATNALAERVGNNENALTAALEREQARSRQLEDEGKAKDDIIEAQDRKIKQLEDVIEKKSVLFGLALAVLVSLPLNSRYPYFISAKAS